MKRTTMLFVGVAGSALLLVNTAQAVGESHPVYRAQAERATRNRAVNRARVTTALKATSDSKAPIAWFAVPPMSDVMRLADTYPEDGRLGGELRIVAAQGEFEPASFLLYAWANRPSVTLSVSPLTGPSGAVLPKANLDLKVVKVWFQNGNAWQSYFADVGLMLVPELLLKDENMVKVDTKAVANYARLKDDKGERHVWISAPNHLENKSFNPTLEPFADAKELQPVALEADGFKQFFLTAHVPEKQPAGVYHGVVTVQEGAQKILEIPVALRVLPFTLPPPRPYFDLDREFIVSFMGGAKLSTMKDLFGGDEALARKRYRAYLENQRDHGIFHPRVDQDKENFALLRELGLPTKPVMPGSIGRAFLPWFGKNFGGRLTFDNVMAAKRGAQLCSDFYMDLVGHNDILMSYGDEQGAAFVATHRNILTYFLERGMKVGCAGHQALLYKGGYVYDFYPMGGAPDAQDRIRPWNEMGGKTVGFYAAQHTGSENPQFIRRQHGLLGYLSNLSMVYNYEFALGPWNDFGTSLYKPMVVAYLNQGGLVDTLQWEGFREGIDDMRYATRLKLLVADAAASGDTARMIAGRKALQYLALLKADTLDLDAVRAEMIEHILTLLALQAEGGAK